MTYEPLELSRLESVPPVHDGRSVDPGSEPGGVPPHGPSGVSLREILVALLFAAAVALLYLGNATAPVAVPVSDPEPEQPPDAEAVSERGPESADDLPGERLDLRLQAQYELGVLQLFDSSAWGGPDALGLEEASARRLDGLAETPRERIALVPVHERLSSQPDAAEQAIDHLAAFVDDPSLDPEVRSEAAAFADLFRQPPVALSETQREHLLATYGWFARLALERLEDAEDEAGGDAEAQTSSAALAEARRAALTLYVLALAAIALFLVGVVSAVVLLQRTAQGKVRSGYALREVRSPSPSPSPSLTPTPTPAASRLPYLETALLFLVAVTLVGAVVALANASLGTPEAGGGHWLLLGNWLVVAVLFWPLARGRSLDDLQRAMGWHRGRGVLVEVGCGLFAYLAALPLLAFGLALTLLVTRFSEQTPHHPIVDWLQEAGPGGIAVVIILAVVWAPLVEESLFRGGLYHYLRGRLGVVGSVSLVSLAFAAIHPQGLAGIPFLATLAVALALTREWRDSIVASVTLHMVHNGLATLLLLVLVA